MATNEFNFELYKDEFLKLLRRLKVRGIEDADIAKSLTYFLNAASGVKASLKICSDYQKIEQFLLNVGKSSSQVTNWEEFLQNVKNIPKCLNGKTVSELINFPPEIGKKDLLQKILLEQQEIASNCVLWTSLTAIPIIFIEINALANSWEIIKEAQFLVDDISKNQKIEEIKLLIKQLTNIRRDLLEFQEKYFNPQLSNEERQLQQNALSLLVNRATFKTSRARKLIDSLKIRLKDKETEIGKTYYEHRNRAFANGANTLLNLFQLVKFWGILTSPWRFVGVLIVGTFGLLTGSNIGTCYCSAKTLEYLTAQLKVVFDLEQITSEVEDLVETIVRNSIGIQNRELRT